MHSNLSTLTISLEVFMKNNQGTNSVFTGSRIPAACWRVGFSRRRFAIAVMMGSLLFMSSGVLAQEERINREGRTSPLVVAAVTDTGVRFTAPGEIGEMRLEVFSSSGGKIFDSAFQRGNVLDWSPSSSAKELSAAMPDPYLCVLTLRDLSGGLDRRQILASLHSDKLTLAADPNRMSAPQAAALASTSNSPVEVETKWLTLPAEGAATLSTHNGTEGQVTSTAGALSFRTGDLFSGKDSERMRITPDGRVGIGTSTPQASLDVAGNINVGGIKFNDGTTLSSATGATKTTPDGTAAALVDGTGTTNRVTKWINGPAGTLGDSAVTEVSGRVGIGTPNPNFQLTMFGNDIGVQLISSGTGALASDGFRFGIDSTNKAFLFNQEATDMFFGTSALERMRISAGGNVGIGTTGPSHKLDVGGNINTSTQYNIGGQAVLRSSSVNANLFVGVNAGLNTVGFAHSNAFFGANAGLNNLGASNAFFGTSAGDTNTTGSFNTMIGTGSDVASTGLTNATAIGQRALVSQSNSLVLGSINGQNGATADTNVGVGTTAPLAKLHLVGTSTTATSPIAILQSSGDEVPLSFRFGATDAARIRTTDFGNLVFATLNGTDKNMFFRAGDDSGTDMFIQSSTGNVGIGTITPANRLEVKDGAVLSSGASGGRFKIGRASCRERV